LLSFCVSGLCVLRKIVCHCKLNTLPKFRIFRFDRNFCCFIR
jgi:hypothetical protein